MKGSETPCTFRKASEWNLQKLHSEMALDLPDALPGPLGSLWLPVNLCPSEPIPNTSD